MEFQAAFLGYGEAFLRLFYPSACAACSRLLELEEQSLCLSCLSQVQKLKLLPSEERIRVSLEYGDEGWALFRYEDQVKDLLHQIKFERRRRLLQVFTKDLILFLARRPQLASYDRIIPVPLDRRRRAEREFNQSGILARTICGILKNQTSSLPRLDERTLAKRRPTPPQSLLGREARKINLSQVFRIRNPKRIQGQSVLLVDDIFTTGSTLEEAAKTLKRDGALRVGYLALARVTAH